MTDAEIYVKWFIYECEDPQNELKFLTKRLIDHKDEALLKFIELLKPDERGDK